MRASFLILSVLITLAMSQRSLITYYDASISQDDDVHINSTLVMVKKTLTINESATIEVQTTAEECQLYSKWSKLGRRVGLVIETSTLNFEKIFQDEIAMTEAALSLRSILEETPFQGVQIYISSFLVNPFRLAEFIEFARPLLNGGFVLVSSRARTLHQGSAVIKATDIYFGQPNYILPILKIQDHIDMLIVRCQDGWYDNLQVEQLAYLTDVTLQWANLPSAACLSISRPCGIFTWEQYTPFDMQKFAIGVENQAGEDLIDIDTLVMFNDWINRQPFLSLAAMYSGLSYFQRQTNYQRSNVILYGRRKIIKSKKASICQTLTK